MTRDKTTHSLVAAENINYGVSRNTWGLKPYGIGASIVGLVSSGLAVYFTWTASVPLMAIAACIICLVWLVLWCSYITRSLVEVAGDGYAKALIGATERLESTSKAA